MRLTFFRIVFSQKKTVSVPHDISKAEYLSWVVRTQVSREWVAHSANLSFKEPHLPQQVPRSFSTMAVLCSPPHPPPQGTVLSQEEVWTVSPSPSGKPGVNLWENRARWRLSQERRNSDHNQKPPPAGPVGRSFSQVFFLGVFLFGWVFWFFRKL